MENFLALKYFSVKIGEIFSQNFSLSADNRRHSTAIAKEAKNIFMISVRRVSMLPSSTSFRLKMSA